MLTCINRVGAEFVEGWVEGQSFKDLKAEMEALEAEKAKLEANKKALAKRKAACTVFFRYLYSSKEIFTFSLSLFDVQWQIVLEKMQSKN